MDISYEKYIGQILDDRYKIIKMIGNGGMAFVFEAFDLSLNRNVAIKMLKAEMASDEQSVKRFINESKAVSMLSHPNIVRIYDMSISGNEKYIVMECVEGITLKSYMEEKGILPPDEILDFSEQILLALEHAHSKGVIHRDIKPQNIMLLQNKKIKVTDFGIAKLPNAETVTMTDKAIGTVYYISPEQASGKSIDQRSDIYSLGVMMYEMATGKLPFTAESPVSVALMQVTNQPQRPHEIMPDIPHGLEQIITAAMKKNPDNRFQSASQMLKYVQQLKADPNFEFKTKQQAYAESMSDDETASTANESDTAAGIEESCGDNDKEGSDMASKKGKKGKKQSRSMFPVICGVTTAFVTVVIISAILLLKMLLSAANESKTQTIEIPHLVGSVYSEKLAAQFDRSIYQIEIVPVYDSSHAENTIVSQEPSGGEKRKVLANKQYCTLILKVCKGAQTVPVPDLRYTSSQQAKIDLDSLGLHVNTVTVASESIDLGYVISTSPEAGETVNIGSTITIYVSAGYTAAKVDVPDLKNLTEQEAAAKIKDPAGEYILKIGKVTEEYSNEVEAGRIISQSLVAKTSVVKGSTINIVFSLGPEPEETAVETGEAETTPQETNSNNSRNSSSELSE